MRKIIYLFLVVFISACASSPETAKEESATKKQILNYAKADQDYIRIAKKITTENATGEDFDRILKLFPLTSFYSSNDKIEQEIKQQSSKYMTQNEWFPCLRVNRQLINRNYTSFTGHYGMAICSHEARDFDGAKYHNWVLDSFIEAIWRTGDGKSPETAFYINTVHDLIAFVQLHQLQVVSQKLIYHGQVPIQSVKVQNPKNLREYDWYFDMTAQFRRAYIDKLEAQ